MAKNDWLVAGLENPTFDLNDYSNILNMDVDNTQFLSKDEYLQSEYIKNNEAFKGEDGNFSEEKFDKYYKNAAGAFAAFQDQSYYQGPVLDLFNPLRDVDTPTKDPHFTIARGINPDRQAIGIEGINVWSDPTLSRRELAQQNKIFDIEKGEFMDHSVNDHALTVSPVEWFKDFVKEPLVLAAYESDGTHIDPITKRERKHKKGDLKLNDKGTYYYETLGNRSVIGKDVLSVTDTFTVDGQGINKYDFFDSDDIEKSVAGCIAKSAATILPAFIPYVGVAYTTALIAKEVTKAMPMLHGIVTAFSDSETPSWVNEVAAYGTKYSSSTSDYARQNTFSFENFSNLVADVALQWSQQRAIASAVTKLKGGKDYIKQANDSAKALYETKRATMGDSEELWSACLNKFLPEAQKKAAANSRLGRDAALMYMAIVSNSSVFNDAIAHGTTKNEAAAIALGSTLGMFAFDKYTGLGELFFDDAAGSITGAAKKSIRAEFQQARKVFEDISAAEPKPTNRLLKYISAASDISKKTLSEFSDKVKDGTLGALGKMVGEGLEEVGEELIMDTSKSIYELAGALGAKTSQRDIGAWENAFDRYAMSFLGGAVGGGVFYAKDALSKMGRQSSDTDTDIATLIRNGHAEELRAQARKLANSGKAGNKHLSATQYELSEDNKVVWRTTEKQEESQNQAVLDLVLDKINSVEEAIIGNRANLTDDELFDNMVLSEHRYKRYKEVAPITNYYQDFSKVLNKVVQDTRTYNQAQNTIEGSINGTKIPNDTVLSHLTEQQKQQRQTNLDVLKENLEASKENLKNFLSGDTSLEYTRKLSFAMDPQLHMPFLEIDETSYLQKLYPGKSFDQLTQEEQANFKNKYVEYISTELKTKLDIAWNKFKNLEKTVTPHLQEVSQSAPSYKAWCENLKNLYTSGALDVNALANSYKTYDDKLDSESDDEYNNRDKKLVDASTGVTESDIDFAKRRAARAAKIEAYNDALDNDWINKIDAELQRVNYRVDPLTSRLLQHILPDSGRLREIINQNIQKEHLPAAWEPILKGLNSDLSNSQEVLDTMRQTIEDQITKQIEGIDLAIDKLSPIAVDGTVMDWETHLMYEVGDPTIQEVLDSYYNRPHIKINNELYEDYMAIVDPQVKANFVKAITDKLSLQDPKIADAANTIFQTFDTDPNASAALINQSDTVNTDVFTDIRRTIALLANEGTGDADVDSFIQSADNFISQELEAAVSSNPLEALSSKTEKGVIDILKKLDQLDLIQDLGSYAMSDLFGFGTSASSLIDSAAIDQYVETTFNPLKNSVNAMLSDIKNNAFFKFQSKLTTGIVNPISELLSKIAATNNDTLPDIEEILNTIHDDWRNLDDVGSLELDDQQRANLEKAANYLNLLEHFIYAASTTPNINLPVGHNKSINDFAEAHAAQLRTPWEKLPEIPSDLATLYMQSVNKYRNEIRAWIELSDRNVVNKIAQSKKIDAAVVNALYGTLSALPRSFTYNGKTFDILNGIDNINSAALKTDMAQTALYDLERLVYKNINQFAADNNMPLIDFIKSSGILKQLLPSIEQLSNQNSTSITASLTANTYTDYDKLLYIGAVITADPCIFYGDLNKRVNGNSQMAPMMSQELAARLAQATFDPTYREFISYARSLMPDTETPTLTNSVVAMGAAGAGKTTSILATVDEKIKKDKVFLVGPTEGQAKAMQSVLNRDDASVNKYNFEDLLVTLLGADQYDKIKTEFESINSTSDYDGTYFSIHEGSDGFIKLKLKADSITFNSNVQAPKAIYIDEATHLTTLQAQLIDAYAKEANITVVMLGDSAQQGYNNIKTAVQNIDEGAVFSVRTPKLSLSLRDSNLQKFQNQSSLRALLDYVLDKRMTESTKDYAAIFPSVQNQLSKMNFKVYKGTEINGDLITNQLDKGTLAALKTAKDNGATIAFLGNDTSPQLTALSNAGINIPSSDIFNLNTIQGREFDYVIIDDTYQAPTNIQEARIFLQKLYTSMTRAKEASIIIDNGLSSIIGKNTISSYKAKAPSIKAKVADLIKNKLSVLSQLDYTPINIKGAVTAAAPTAAPTATSTAAPANSNTSNTSTAQPTPKSATPTSATPSTELTPEDFVDPDTRKEPEVEQAIQTMVEEESVTVDDQISVDPSAQEALDRFPIECYSDVTFLAVNTEDNVVRAANDKNHTEKSGILWRVPVVQGERRNLQALLSITEKSPDVLNPGNPPKGAEAFWYKEKIELQNRLSIVKSALKFGHSWEDLIKASNIISDNFTKEEWEKGTYELEFREPSPTDIAPIHSELRDAGAEYIVNGNKRRVIANIIFKVTDREGNICKFDLAGINNPETLNNNKAAIRTKLQSIIDNPNTDDATKTRLNDIVSNIDLASQEYRNWFNARLSEFAAKGSLSIDVSNIISHNNTTWFTRRRDKKRPPIRLGGHVNPLNVDKNDVNSLMDRNPDKNFSSVYTFSGNEIDFYNLDPSLKGKAVIFVSDDLLIPKSELVSRYLNQKRKGNNFNPVVRMIRLDNYGLTFQQLCDASYIKNFMAEGERKPFRQNFTGIRMFTSLWNARAALIKFTDAYSRWKTENNLTDAQAKAITQIQYMAYSNEPAASIETVAKGANLGVDQALSLLEDFNNKNCKDIPMFRLGYNTNGNGFHIQRFNVDGSISYKGKKEANLCSIDIDKANQFLKMLDEVIRPICPKESDSNVIKQMSLDLHLAKSDSTRWGEDEFIDLTQADHQRTLSGLLSLSWDTLNIETYDDDGNPITLAYAKGEHWSSIPLIISNLVRKIDYLQAHPDEMSNPNALYAKVTYHESNGHEASSKDDRVELSIDLNSFLAPGGLLAPSVDGKKNHSLHDMFHLIFHGTTDDIHRPVGDGTTTYTKKDGTTGVRQPRPQLDDAYFKQGFFINPNISRKTGSDGKIVGHYGLNSEISLFEIETSPALFTVDVDLRGSGFRLPLGRLISLTKPKPQQTAPTQTSAPAASTAPSQQTPLTGPAPSPKPAPTVPPTAPAPPSAPSIAPIAPANQGSTAPTATASGSSSSESMNSLKNRSKDNISDQQLLDLISEGSEQSNTPTATTNQSMVNNPITEIISDEDITDDMDEETDVEDITSDQSTENTTASVNTNQSQSETKSPLGSNEDSDEVIEEDFIEDDEATYNIEEDDVTSDIDYNEDSDDNIEDDIQAIEGDTTTTNQDSSMLWSKSDEDFIKGVLVPSYNSMLRVFNETNIDLLAKYKRLQNLRVELYGYMKSLHDGIEGKANKNELISTNLQYIQTLCRERVLSAAIQGLVNSVPINTEILSVAEDFDLEAEDVDSIIQEFNSILERIQAQKVGHSMDVDNTINEENNKLFEMLKDEKFDPIMVVLTNKYPNLYKMFFDEC